MWQDLVGFRRRFLSIVSITALFLLPLGLACNGGTAPLGNTPTANNGSSGNTLLNDALGFDGTLSGKLFDSQSTRTAAADQSAAQVAPPDFDTTKTVVRFRDLAGNDLLDPQGNPISEVPVASDGSFTATGLPVGTDFTICGDIDKDGTCDVESFVTIPADEGKSSGRLDGVRADPLTTLVLAKVRALLEEDGINLQDFPVSLAVIVSRVVDTYVNLFEETGVDDSISLSDISNVAPDQLASEFDSRVPETAQTGIRITEGNIAVNRAKDAEALALAAAEVFVRAGFPIADTPGGPDFGSLANLDGILTTNERELFGSDPSFPGPGGGPDGIPPELLDQLPGGVFDQFPDGPPADFLDQLPPDVVDQIPGGLLDQISIAQVDSPDVIYVSTVSEPDRNFVGEEPGMGGGTPQLPVLNDRILLEMAKLKLNGFRITLGGLYDVLTSVDNGLGVRLVFDLPDPNFAGPPLTVFQTTDGKGRAINLDRLFSRVFDAGVFDVNTDQLNRDEGNVRGLLRELLGGTIAPSFGRLFDGFLKDRIAGIEDLARFIREARAHLPFNRSGPRSFFVVADGDSFSSGATTSAVTVDADVNLDGEVLSVSYNAEGQGRFYLGFTERTEEKDRVVELLVRETGRFLHGRRGPVRLSMLNDSLFEPVNGVPFADFVSESGTFFPGTHVPVARDHFMFDPAGPNNMPNPDEQLFVLATGVGMHAEPVRVDYDRTTGTATFNPFGRHLLMFLPDSQDTGLFALFNEDTGRTAALADPVDFFAGPVDRPDGFEDFFNQVDNFGDFGSVDSVDQFVNDVIDPFANTGALPDQPVVDGTVDDMFGVPAPLDGSLLPPDGSATDTVGTAGVGDVPPDGGLHEPGLILVAADAVVGLDLQQEMFVRVFGMDVPNERFDPDADPFYDDINANGVQDPGEPTASFRPTLFDPRDWRSTDIGLYYRRADNNQAVQFDNVAFDSSTPKTIDGVDLVVRQYQPRLNAFRFGRPNTAINLLTAFLPPNFFDGTRGLNRNTSVDIFTALAGINLVMDQLFNVEANIDFDGLGPLPRQQTLVDAHLFVFPLDDPFVLILKGFRDRSQGNFSTDTPATGEPTDVNPIGITPLPSPVGSDTTGSGVTDANTTDGSVDTNPIGIEPLPSP